MLQQLQSRVEEYVVTRQDFALMYCKAALSARWVLVKSQNNPGCGFVKSSSRIWKRIE